MNHAKWCKANGVKVGDNLAITRNIPHFNGRKWTSTYQTFPVIVTAIGRLSILVARPSCAEFATDQNDKIEVIGKK